MRLNSAPIRFASIAITAVLWACPLLSAERYHFSSVTEGPYATEESGIVAIDGSRWRIDFQPTGVVQVMTSALHTSDGKTVALNEGTRTWYPIDPSTQFAATSPLFGYAGGGTASRVLVMKAGSDDPARLQHSISYSYRIDADSAGERVQIQVSGDVSVWTRSDSKPSQALPWNPMQFRTGFTEVDQTLARALNALGGTMWKMELRVTRRFDGGAPMTQVIRRSIDPMEPIAIPRDEFSIPADYTMRPPVVGAPGAELRTDASTRVNR